MRAFGLVVPLFLLGSGLALAQAPAPVYTPLQDCPKLDRLVLPERTIVRSPQEGLYRCKGPAGYDLIVIDQDPRSWLAVQVGGKAYSLQGPMAQQFRLGHFPDISTTRVVEWRMNAAGAPTAFIVRVHYQDPNVAATAASANKSTLMVFSLTSLPPRHLGSVADNDAARRLADGQ